MTISRDSWLSALQQAEDQGDPDALSVQEFAEMLGCKRFTAQARLNLMVEKQLAVRTHKYKNGGGGRIRVPAYRLVQAETPVAKKKR